MFLCFPVEYKWKPEKYDKKKEGTNRDASWNRLLLSGLDAIHHLRYHHHTWRWS